MDAASAPDCTEKAGWFSPQRLLLLLSSINMMIYIDRGVISSNGVNGAVGTADVAGSGIQGDFGLSLFQDGILPAAFMVGLLICSPLFAEASKHYNAFRLIAIGLGVWTLATAGCGVAVGFWSLVVCRMAVGVGEASFVSLAAPFIDDNAPAGAKTRWLATFYLCIPVGYALGYIFGGLVAGPLGWRAAFLLEAAAMLPFLAFCTFAPALDLRGSDGAATDGALKVERGVRAALRGFGADLAAVLRHPVFAIAVAGTTLYTGVIGAYAYLGPKAGRDTFRITGETADLTFGGVTVATGVAGTLLGGVLLDRMGASLKNALLICAGGAAVGCVCVALGFGLAPSLWTFVPPFTIGELALFSIQAPSNALVLWSVPPRLRPFAMAMVVVINHLLGDVPSSPAIGGLQDAVQNWRLSMCVCTLLLLPSAACFLGGRAACALQPDYHVDALAAAAQEASLDGVEERWAEDPTQQLLPDGEGHA
ncbi:hypothetical protein WJX81_006376 [Elliptochloris bilobata]|uniref:Major facilitator superfamily (MFS) profile domain-containing protein n=1 Tax=Elliptochloris bilobata TaxID=381761 RepID=A0AAW1RUK4_9CHLO